MFYLDVIPDPRPTGDGGLFIALVAVVLALIFFAAIAAAGIFLFVRRRNQRSADTAPAQQPFAESQ
jgi:hypothetical protein